MNIFRTATGQAIRDIIADHSQENRFGRTLTEDDLDTICERVVDLFEMTLNLRARVSGSSEHSEAQQKPQSRAVRWEDEPAQMPTTRAASEVYDFSGFNQKSRQDALPNLAPNATTEPEYKLLRRKRTAVSAEEQQRLMRQAERSPLLAQRPSP
jgi:hypothetical protein